MLHLVLGRAGSGKTAYAIEKAASCGTKAVLLVPEQFTFEAEKHLLSRAGPRAGLSIEVLSFKRLAHRVFSLYGGVARRYIGECGKYIVMRMALRQVADTLHVYEGQAAGPAFVKAMVDTVEEYRTYGATPEVLGKISDKVGGGLLHDKLLDVRLVYETYQALLGENRYDAADELEVLARTLEGHRFFENKTVVADSFKGFTPQERMVLARIMAQARDVYITLCADELNGAGLGLFAPVQKTAQQLITVANRVGVPVAAPMCLPAPRRFRTPALRFLEEKIFRASGAAYEGDAPEIRLVTAENFYEEAQFAAQTIAALVREQGCRFRDIVVIAGEPELYRGILDPVFEKYDIPLFLDARRAVDTHPLMVYVLSLFEIVLEDFRPGQVPRCLKTGLTDLSVEEISALENYTLQWNIKGFDVWNAPFTGNPAGFGQAMTPADEKALAALNGIRARLMKRLAVFRRQLQGAQKSGEFCRYVYEFLKSDGIEEKLPRLCEAFKAAGELELADEYLRMWEALVGVLDQLALTIGDFSVEPRDFYELLKLGITASDIGHIPASLDEVTFGDAERIRTGEAQYVFVLGLAEGIFPRSESSGGLFTRAERRRLGLAGLELSPAGREQAEEERFFAYKAFTCASRGVWLCCPRSNAAGAELRPSVFFREAEKLFPHAAQTDVSFEDPLDAVQNEASAFEALALGYRRGDALNAALRACFESRPGYGRRLAALEKAARRGPFAFEDKAAAARLYGGDIPVSPSRVELHRECRFAYFCRYGLSARPRRKAELAAPEIGTLIHFVLERLLSGGKDALLALSPAELASATRQRMEQYAVECMGGLEDKSERFRHLFYELQETAELLVRHIARELAQSEFVPVDFELSIGRGGDVEPLILPLEGGGRLIVEGRVDRVDIMKKGTKTYLRVIDYKTGGKTFRLSDVAQGLNMQMLIYLFTLCRRGAVRYGGEPVPAGVLYLPAKRPVLSEPRGTDAAVIEKESDDSLCMNGLVLRDSEVVLGMEKDGAGVYIPVKCLPDKKGGDGQVLSGSTLADLAQLGALSACIEQNLRSMASSLREGDIAAVPVQNADYNPCTYCDFADVCGFEPGNAVDALPRYKDDQVWEGLAGVGKDKPENGGPGGKLPAESKGNV